MGLAFAVCGAQAETLVLTADFVKRVKNKAAMQVNLKVDAHPDSPHRIKSGGDDGDIHMAGRADEVQLPLVAEIVNARKEEASMKLLKQTAAGQTLQVRGVWRIWFEHLGKEDQIQGSPVDVPGDSNPAHLFEIHPITKFADQEIKRTSFVPIVNEKSKKSYTAYPAHVAFPFYEKAKATISAKDGAVTITSGAGKYNYAEFVIELAGKAQSDGDDGLFVLATVHDTEEESEEEAVTEDVRRMVFVQGTKPADQVAGLSQGRRLHVLGIPRLNLAEVAEMATEEPTKTRLPYEMIIVAVLPDSK